MSEHVLSEVKDGVMRLTLAREDKKNALTMAMYAALTAALNEAAGQREVRCVLIQGAGGDFTAGNDIGDFMKHPPTDTDTPVFQFLRALHGFEKPVVAAVRGVAVGIGTTMLLHCDLVVASQSARLKLPFVNLGLVPEAGSSLLLPAMMGHQRAARLLMLGETFDAQTALELGVVSLVVEDQALEETAASMTRRLAASPPEALRQTKALMRTGVKVAAGERMMEEGVIFMQRLQSPEAKEAFSAFAEKRKPDFSRF